MSKSLIDHTSLQKFRKNRHLFKPLKKSSEAQIDSINLGLASPTRILKWAERILPNGKKVGEVVNAKTVNYKTLKPETGGLFCEKIFGPIEDFECLCNPAKRKPKTQNKFCPDCDVEFTVARIRRYRLGHIKLASPVSHIWYLRGRPRFLNILFDRAISLKTKKKKGKIKDLKPIIYGMDGIYVSIFRLLETNRKTPPWAPCGPSEESLAKRPFLPEGALPFGQRVLKKKRSFCHSVTAHKRPFGFPRPRKKQVQRIFARRGSALRAEGFPFGFLARLAGLGVLKKQTFSGPFWSRAALPFALQVSLGSQKLLIFAGLAKTDLGLKNPKPSEAEARLMKKTPFFLSPKVRRTQKKPQVFWAQRGNPKKKTLFFSNFCFASPAVQKLSTSNLGLLRYPRPSLLWQRRKPMPEGHSPSEARQNGKKHSFFFYPRPFSLDFLHLKQPRFYDSTWSDAQATATTKTNFVPLRSPDSHKQPIKLSASIFTYNFLDESGLLWYDLANHNVNLNISLNFCFARNKSCFARPFGLSRANANTLQFFFKTRYFTQASKNTCSAAPTKKNILFKKNFNKIVCNSCHCQYNPQSLPTTSKVNSNLNGLKFNSCSGTKTIYPYQKNKNLVFNRNKRKKMTGFLREEKLFLNIEVLKTESLIFFTEKKSANLPVGQQKNQLFLSFPLIKSKFYRAQKNLLTEAPFVLKSNPQDTSRKNPMPFGHSPFGPRPEKVKKNYVFFLCPKGIAPYSKLFGRFRFSNPEAAFLTVQGVGSQKPRWFAEAPNLLGSKNPFCLASLGLCPSGRGPKGAERRFPRWAQTPGGPSEESLRKKRSFCFAAPKKPVGPSEESLTKRAIAKQSNTGRLAKVRKTAFGPNEVSLAKQLVAGPFGPQRGLAKRPAYGPFEPFTGLGPAKQSIFPAKQVFPVFSTKRNLLSQIDSYYPISSRCVFKFIKGEENKTLEFKDLWSSFTKYMTSNFVKQDTIIQRYSNRLENRYILQNGFEYKSIKTVLTGSEAIWYWLKNLNLHVLESILKRKIKNLDDKINRHRSRSNLYKFQEKTLKNIIKYRRKVYRIIKLVHYLKRNRLRPDWLMISILPVLPPNLRPIIQLQSNQMAVSDLNQLYKRVLYRNTRIERYFNRSRETDSHERRFHQRLLQEAVDSLLDNGKGGSPLACSPNGRPFKSLAEILKGKKGRFRQNLLGKRVDYSGRSVIVVGPELKLHECGLPKEMALELFQPFIIRDLINLSHQDTDEKITIVLAKYLIKTEHSIVWEILQKILKNHPILLNRAPTLHRLGIQAFIPKLVDGRAILLHPLVCPAFNADFDGDQMAVHVPLCFQSRAEAWKLMWSRNNLLSPATGEPIIVPSQDMVLGCYYLTTINTNSAIRAFNHPQSSFSVGGKTTFTIREARKVPQTWASKAKPLCPKGRAPSGKTVFHTTLKLSAFQKTIQTLCPKGRAPSGLRKKQSFCFAALANRGKLGPNEVSLAKRDIKSTSITTISEISENLACSDILTLQNKNYSKNQFKQSIIRDGDVSIVMLGKYFSSLDDVLVAFSQNKLFLHSLIWVKWTDRVEIENFNEKPIEIRIDRYGNVHKIYSKYFQHVDNQNRQISQFILTTVGRIILNKTITKNSSL